MEDKITEAGEFRCWEELIPDALGLIFNKLPLQDTLTVIPRVCKSWGKAVSGPYCWQEIDIEEWSSRSKPDQLNRMLEMLVTRSGGSFRKLSVIGLQNSQFLSYIAKNASSLEILRMPRSDINDSDIEQIADRLCNLTHLDLSYCDKIGASALKAIGKNCKHLSRLCRVMHPLDVVNKICQDDEALAIASTMPNLKHLEVAYLLISTEAAMKIISSCKELEFLDVRGCWNLQLDGLYLKEKYSGLKVLGPLVQDCYDRHYWDYEFSDYSDSSDFVDSEDIDDVIEDYYEEGLDDTWADDRSFENLQVWFYDGFDELVASDWLQDES